MEKKSQHVIPCSYLKGWADPATPVGHTPYVWVHKKEEKQGKKIAPKNIFTKKDFYTYQSSGEERNLTIENGFGKIEDAFARIRESAIKKLLRPTPSQCEDLCVFASMMHVRTEVQKKVWTDNFSRLHENIRSFEEWKGLPPVTSLITARYLQYAHQTVIGTALEKIAMWLNRMNMVIFVAEEGSAFITSDNPSVWFNPERYKMPPLFRNDAIANEKIEISLPLSPECLMMFSWSDVWEKISISEETKARVKPYLPIPAMLVSEMNRRVRFETNMEYVTHNGKIEEHWFDPGVEPEDSWEKLHPEAAVHN
jgi:hypothetical protein